MTAVENAGMLDRAVRWLDGRADALRDVCEGYRVLLLGVLSIVYFDATSVLAMRKPMWNDELFTYFIAQAPSLSGIWSALLTGADQTPFPFYVLTRWSLGLFGINEWALRLPEMVGVWVAACVSLHIVAKPQCRALWVHGNDVSLLVTNAHFYSYEARPYGLVFGFSALAWLCWGQQATNGRGDPGFLSWGYAESLSAAAVSATITRFLCLFRLESVSWCVLWYSPSCRLANLVSDDGRLIPVACFSGP